MRTIMMLGFVTGAVALALACSESSTDNNSSSGGTSSSSGASGNTSSGTSGDNTSGGSSAFKDCSSQSQPQGTCTEAEMKPYSDCYETNCGPAYAECFGADYKTGKFSGPCGDYITCIQSCECSDNTCVLNCVKGMSEACQTCSQKFETCGSSCDSQLPECAKTSNNTGDGGAGTCADLKACCDKMADGDTKTSCNGVHESAAGNDATCGAYYNSFKALCP